ncbi:MAG: Cupin [Candidatus Magasanikbacteria bacterium GW2011_GWC2_37_14]|uniref:Cupin n=1 Tax=Candidatus Magasanikbacteria bacterium GW2011_GWC2_37_14 TaxID=1619046 RepID=A0A0G0GCB4_9BACT|nr:MAG: Cupin [Candidatus Magasanikbacteria bacterium GW2011_GWC2_37_14]
MLIKKFANQKEIIAGDNCLLREFINVEHGDKVDCRYSLAWSKMPVTKKTWKHTMKTSEVYFILKGKGKMYINDEAEEVGVYDTVYIPPNATQYIENIGEEDLEFICIVDPAWRKEDEVVLES